RVADVFVQEEVQAAHADVGGRQPAEVGRPRGCGVRLDVRGARAASEVGVPADVVAGAIPYATVEDRVATRRLVAVVDHRVDEMLVAERDRGTVAGEECKARRQSCSGTPAADPYARPVDAQRFRLLVQPAQASVTVLQ